MKPLKLNQVLAIEKTVKKQAQETLTVAYQNLSKPALFTGMDRVYTPKDDEGDKLPSEKVTVQTCVQDLITSVEQDLVNMFDTIAQKDLGNCSARADVVVRGETVLKDVPAVTLLFLEKQLTDLQTFISKIPVLDSAHEWSLDASTQKTYRSSPVTTNKTKKVMKNHVKAEATDKHPAQVETFNEDVNVGTWTTVHTSGATTLSRREQMLTRARELAAAVKVARESANLVETQQTLVGKPVLDFIFRV